MAQTTTNAFKLARNSQDYPTKQVELLLPNWSKPNKYGCVASADSEATGFEATHTNDGNKTHLGGYWKANNGTILNNVVARWYFDDDCLDSSVVGNDLTASGSPTYAAAKINNGINLESGSSQYAYRTVLNLYGTFSFSFWFNAESISGGNFIFMNGKEGVGGAWSWRVYLGGDGTLTFQYVLDTLEVKTCTTTDTFNTATWYHIAITRNTTTGAVEIYIDGSVCTHSATWEESSGAIRSSGSESLFVGAYNSGGASSFYDGILDEFYITSDVLSSTEITALYNSGNAARLASADQTGILTHALLPETNSKKLYDSTADFDLGTLTDTQDTEVADKVKLTGLYDSTFLPEWANCKLALKLDNAAASGLEEDYSGNNNHAIEYGTVPSVAGIIGNSRGVFSADNYFKVSDNSNIRASDNFSVSFWVKRTGDASGDLIVKGNVSDDYGFVIFQDEGAYKIDFFIGILPVSVDVESVSSLALNTWTHIVGTYDIADTGKELKIYINGVEDATFDCSAASPIPSTDDLFIGIANDGVSMPLTNALIDELLVYQKTLSPANITALYAAGAPYRRTASGTWQSEDIDWGYVPLVGGSTGILWDEELFTNTTLTCELQYSVDGTNWGVNSPTYDDTNWDTVSNGDPLDLTQYVRAKFTFATSDQLYSPSLANVYLHITPQTRKVGQVDLYGYTGVNSLTEFKLQYWDGLAWTDIEPTKAWGFKRNQSAMPTITITDEVITSTDAEEYHIQFAEVQTNKIRLNITGTSNAGAPILCEMETYQRVQFVNSTDRSKNYFISFNNSRNLDYLGRWFQGMDWSIQALNDKRNFSPQYKPTPSEIVDGYFNDFLNSPCKVQVWAGYDNEDVLICSGFVDGIAIDSGSRIATFSGRDNYYLLTKKDLTISNDEVATKTLENCIEYVLNKCNIPSSQITMATTGVTLDYFFTLNQKPVDTLKSLVEATGNSFLVGTEFNRFEMFYKTQERKWIESTLDEFKAGSHTSTSYWDKEGSVVLEMQNGDLPNNNFETWINEHQCEWWKLGTKGSGYCIKISGYSGYGVKITGPYGVFPFWNGQLRQDFPIRVKLEVQDENQNVILYNLWNTSDSWIRYSQSLNTYKNKKIRIRIMTATYAQDNWDKALYPENSGDIESPYFICSGGSLSFLARKSLVYTAEAPAYGYDYFIDSTSGGRRSYITPGTYISQSHDCTGAIETITGFTTARAGINKPINTTMTFSIQFSTDNTNWGTNSAAFDDNNWQALTMTDINGTDSTNSAVAITGDVTGTISDPGDESVIRYIRYKCVMVNTDDDITPELQEMRINWLVGSGSTISTTPSFAYGYEGAAVGAGLLKSLQGETTSIESNNSRIYTNTIATVNAIYESAAAEQVWDGMQGEASLAIASTITMWAELDYPTKLAVNTTVLTITEGAGNTTYNATETGTKALASGDGTVEVIWGTQKCKIILTLTGSVTFSVFKIEGYNYKEKQKIEINVNADNYDTLIEDFGEVPLKIDNEFIFSYTIAEDIATAAEKYYQTPRLKVSGLRVAFSPDIQMLDCVQIYDYNSGIKKNFWVTELSQDLSDRGSTNITVEEI